MKTKKWRKRLRGLCVAIALWLILPAVCHAAWVTIAINGEVSYIEDHVNAFGGNIILGTAITGTYTYESTIQDSEPLDSGVGFYEHSTTPAGISLCIGGFSFVTDSASVDFDICVRDNNVFGEDRYWIWSRTNLPLAGNLPVDSIIWDLTDSTGTALSNDLLPAITPDFVDKWDAAWFSIDSDSQRNFVIQGQITSAIVVPEPTTLLLLMCGLLVSRRLSR